MFDKIVSVSDCPDDVREALVDQGYPIDGDVKIDTAIGVWAQFHIGDSQWGNDACDHIAHMNSQRSNQGVPSKLHIPLDALAHWHEKSPCLPAFQPVCAEDLHETYVLQKEMDGIRATLRALRNASAEVLEISDRKHAAWDRLRGAIASVPSE